MPTIQFESLEEKDLEDVQTELRPVRSQKEFRKSLRSTDSADLQDRNLAIPIVKTARSISSSLRHRFKQVFSRNSSGMPPQQLDASRAYFGGEAFEIGNGGFDNYIADEIVDGKRVSLYHDPWHEKIEEEDLQKLSNLAPVNKSANSLTTSSKSRVTSWTNTTPSGSLREPNMIERKRLSVIQEDGGPHQPSSSAGTHLGGVSIFRKPVPSPHGQAPDPQRLYSALVRRINQESDDREGLAAVPEYDNPVDHIQDQTIRTVTSSTVMDGVPDIHQTSPSEDGQKKRIDVFNQSQESIYSAPCQADGNTPARYDAILSDCDLGQGIIPFKAHDLTMYRLNNESNPYASALDIDNEQQHGDLTATQDVWAKDVDKAVESVARSVAPKISARSLPEQTTNINLLIKKATHIREEAQFYSEQSTPQANKASYGMQSVSQTSLVKNGVSKSRSPTPSSVPDQLAVAKKRFPLLNVKQVAKGNTPIPSRNSSLTRSQSGLLQLITSEQDHSKEDHVHENKLTTSLRKISPENVARLLKSKASLVTLHRHEKENRIDSNHRTPDGKDEEPYAVSTPGPGFLAMRSGNSLGRRQFIKDGKLTESPTDLVKATLSARLSRPFNMDTPEVNRPFDSMYLGKRELGYSDVAGGRLSVAHQAGAVLGYDKRASFDRGPGGYGGLGPSPLESGETDTALPHVPSPEYGLKHKASKLSLTLGSKRMVSNFLRSRRKATSDEVAVSHDEHVQHDIHGNSPVFV